GEDDRDDFARASVLGRLGDERGPAGVAELRVGSALTPARRAAWCERLAAAVAEPGLRPVRSPATGAVHGDMASTPRGLPVDAGARPQPRTIADRLPAVSSSAKKHRRCQSNDSTSSDTTHPDRPVERSSGLAHSACPRGARRDKKERDMRGRYLEVTFRKGRAIAAYLYLPRRGAERAARVSKASP